MTNWIIGTALVGVVFFLLSIYQFMKDNRIMVKKQKAASYLLPNLTLLLFAFGWFLLAGYLYIDVQQQLTLFLN